MQGFSPNKQADPGIKPSPQPRKGDEWKACSLIRNKRNTAIIEQSTFKEQQKWGKHIFHKMPDAVAVCNSVIGNVQEICLQARKAEHINTINEACYGEINTTWFP
jgi:hypothetical protein